MPTQPLNPNATPFNPADKPFPAPSINSIIILSLNCRSVVNKVADLTVTANSLCPHIICLTETWLTPSNVLHIPGYDVFRRDRPPADNKSSTTVHGYGGVAILIRENLFHSVQCRNDLSRHKIESVWVEIQMSPHIRTPLVVGCFYRPPSQSAPELSHFCDLLTDSLMDVGPASPIVFLAGDFNAHNQVWCSTDTTSSAGSSIQHVMECFGMKQMVQFPTYSNRSGACSCLDLLITNAPERVADVDYLDPLGASDHKKVLCKLKVADFSPACSSSPSRPPQQQPTYMFRSATPETWKRLNDDLALIDWQYLLDTGDINSALDNFMHVLDLAFDCHLAMSMPPRANQSSRRPKFPPWVTPSLRTAIKHKHDLYSVYKKYPTAQNLHSYKRQRNITRALSRSCHRSYVRSIKSTLSNPSTCPNLYSFVRMTRIKPMCSISSSHLWQWLISLSMLFPVLPRHLACHHCLHL